MYVKEEFEGTDRFREWAQHRFWRINVEAPKTFLERRLAPTDRRQKLNNRSKLLLTLTWLKCYHTYALLSMVFNVTETMVCDVINLLWSIFC